jgi:hypothetical protein
VRLVGIAAGQRCRKTSLSIALTASLRMERLIDSMTVTFIKALVTLKGALARPTGAS